MAKRIPKRPPTKASDKAPTQRTCATREVHERLMRSVPGYREARDLCENQAWRAAMTGMIGRTDCRLIPCVVHVVYKANAQNISDAQIKSQIDVLNEDFRKKNSDATSAPAPFQTSADDARIQFELASKDPNGAATTGIVRAPATVNSFSSNDDVKF